MKRTAAIVLALASTCAHPPAQTDAPTRAQTPVATSSVDNAPTPQTPTRRDSRHDEVQRAIALAYPDAPLPRTEFDQLLVEIGATTDTVVAAARVFAAARRSPPELLARLWTGVPPNQVL